MKACNELMSVMGNRVETLQRDIEIESIGLDLRRISAELGVAKLEGKRDAEKIVALTADWKRICHERAAFAAEVVSQRARMAELEARKDQDIQRATHATRREVARRYIDILRSLEEKWANKEKETTARIQVQEVVENINILIEIKDGGFVVDEELDRLKELEKDCRVLVDLNPVLGWIIPDLDLPQISEDSDQGEPSSARGKARSI